VHEFSAIAWVSPRLAVNLLWAAEPRCWPRGTQMKIGYLGRRRSVHVRIALACGWALGIAVATLAGAQDYPTRPIKLIVPFTAGSVQDLRARHIGGLLGPRLGEPIVVDNRPGASGAIGSAVVAKSKPDGYTFLLCTSATLGGNAALIPNLSYDPIRDFTPVVRLVTTWGIVAVDAGSGIQTLQQLLARAKIKPGTVRYGSGNSYAHILGELLSQRAGVELLYVPYKGDAQALTDLLGGHIDVIFSTPLLLVPQAKAGRIRALGVAGPRRLPALPDVPTLSEQNVPSSELPAWAGICAPAGTPAIIVRRINREALSAMMLPEVRAEVEGQGYEISANTPEEFLAFIKTDVSRTVTLVRELGMPPEQ
jgi:tripartite-type tricarboxylate transporter receptor subunit TctC